MSWPELKYAEWKETLDTLHMWTQIVGKTRMALAPHENHFWEVPLYVTARGLSTSAMPVRERGVVLDIEFDFVEHVLRMRVSDGSSRTMVLKARSVADFYAEYMRLMGELDVVCHIWPVPVEVPEGIPFAEDTKHATYEREAALRFWQVLLRIDTAFKKFRAGFMGKQSPVHFWWGSFDLAVTRFSGKGAPARPKDPKFMQEAYSHEEISVGWWPGNGGLGEAAFYGYMVPPPDGFAAARVKPEAAYGDGKLGEFLLKYEDVRNAAEPEAVVLEFGESVYEAGAKLAG